MVRPLRASLPTAEKVYFLVTRRISGGQKAIVTTFHTNALGCLLASVLVIFVWQTPTLSQWGQFLALAAIANVGHYFIVRAYDHAEASLLAPLAYTEIVMATVLGWWFFGDLPDGWTILGVGILIASALYISARAGTAEPA